MSDGFTPIDPTLATNFSTQAASDVASKVATGKFEVDAGSVVGSMSALKELDPDLHRSIMQGIAESILREMREHAARLKKLIREGQQQF